jgi:hypothetical protein
MQDPVTERNAELTISAKKKKKSVFGSKATKQSQVGKVFRRNGTGKYAKTLRRTLAAKDDLYRSS